MPDAGSQTDWLEADRRFVWHPYTQMLTAPPPLPVVKAEGIYLHLADGRRVIDAISSWWVNIHGHSHPRLNRALIEQANKLQQVIFAGFTHEPGARLAEQLVERAPGKLSHVFYSDDGSTAVEVGLKLAYQYWKNRGDGQRTLFVALDSAYHGDTFGAMAAGGVSVFHTAYSDLFFRVLRASAPTCLRCPVGLTRPSCQVQCKSSLTELLSANHERVAAVIIEPMVQGAGGMIVWPREFLQHVRDETRRFGIPLIADEVFTGFGRTGKMFACEHGPVEPDILCLSKAITGGYMPLGATLASDEIYEAFLSEDRSQTFFHGHSYTGNALACALALESLSIFDDEGCLGRIAQLSQLFGERLERLRNHPLVADVRGLGALAVIELGAAGDGQGDGYLATVGPKIAAGALAQGVLLRPLGNVIYVLPPYVITDAEAHRVFDVLERQLDELQVGRA